MVSRINVLMVGVFVLGLGILLAWMMFRSDKAYEWDEGVAVEAMILIGISAIVYSLFF